jgi:hypothetical protein
MYSAHSQLVQAVGSCELLKNVHVMGGQDGRWPSFAAADISLPRPEVHHHLMSEGASHRIASPRVRQLQRHNSSELAVHAGGTCLSPSAASGSRPAACEKPRLWTPRCRRQVSDNDSREIDARLGREPLRRRADGTGRIRVVDMGFALCMSVWQGGPWPEDGGEDVGRCWRWCCGTGGRKEVGVSL